MSFDGVRYLLELFMVGGIGFVVWQVVRATQERDRLRKKQTKDLGHD